MLSTITDLIDISFILKQLVLPIVVKLLVYLFAFG